MSPNLPVELYVQILRELPAEEQTTLSTVVSFLSTSSLLRTAALEASVWERLYQSRYPNCDETNEKERRKRLQGDIRLLFAERHKANREALLLLERIRAEPENGQALASRVVREMSFDVWDVLGLETRLPIPKVFRDQATDNMEEEAAPHALPGRFWAKALRGAIARNYAVRIWADMRVRPEEHTFDDVLLGFSAFMDFSPKETIKQLDAMAALCRLKLSDQGVQVDSGRPDYDLAALATAIRDFLHNEGFAAASGESFMNPLNQFPHYLLGPGRSETLPMSINWVFAAVCHRLGVKAGPTNTPGRVLCHISSHDPQHGDILLDVCSATPPVIFSTKDVATMLAEAGVPSDVARADAILPAELPVMLRRAAYNIFNVTRLGNLQFGEAGDIKRRADYAASVAIAAVCDPHEVRFGRGRGPLQSTPQVPPDCPLDAQAVLLDLLPNVPAQESQDNGAMFGLFPLARRNTAPPRHRPHPKFRGFVGQLTSTGPDLGCIFGWEWTKREDAPSESAYYILMPMGIMPFYMTNFSGIPGAPLTAENARRLRREIVCFDQYFEDAVIPTEDGLGGRLVPSMEIQTAYPEDLEYGARWTAEQLEKAGRTEGVIAH